MNLRKLRRERAKQPAAATTVDGSTVKALPAGEVVAPEVNGAKVEPLSSHAGGRDEARAAFVADAGGPPPESPTSSTTSSPPGSGGAHGAAHAAPESPAAQLTVEQVAAFGVALLDTLAQRFGPQLGGEPHNWAQTDDERKLLTTAGTPLAAKWFADQQPTPEAMFIIALASVYAPRAMAAKRAARVVEPAVAPVERAHEAAPPREAPPPPPPPPAAPPPPRVNVDSLFG